MTIYLSRYLRLPFGLLFLFFLLTQLFQPPNPEQHVVKSVTTVTVQYRKFVEWTVDEAMQKIIEKLDTNRDGRIQMDEVRAHALAAIEQIRNSTPSAKELESALSHFTWRELVWRYFLLQLTFLTLLFVLENIRGALFWGPRRLLLDNSYLTHEPPRAGAEVALTYDTPWTNYERFKLVFFTVTGLLFVRLFFFFVFALWSMASVSLTSWKGRNRRNAPWWFMWWTSIGCLFAHMASAMIGVYHVKLYGNVAGRSECKVLIGNHSCIIEVVVIFILAHFPSFVTRKENTAVPLFSGVTAVSDAIVVNRDAALSRHQTADAIFSRAKDRDPDAPQLIIFPEGTTANQRSLFLFKKGAFEAGEPVQMICVCFPYKHFNPCWTGRACGGNSVIDLFIRLCSQFVTHCEVRALPVYVPTDEERKDPMKFADHCQRMMATTLRSCISSFSYKDYENVANKKKYDTRAKGE